MLPYVMYTVEELSLVKNLKNWGNCNVQFIGKIFDTDGVFTCEGFEKSTSTGICLDFSLSAQIPPRNTNVRIWGELELRTVNNQLTPVVKVKISNVIGSIDIPLFRKSNDIRRDYVPKFIDRPQAMQAPADSSERSMKI